MAGETQSRIKSNFLLLQNMTASIDKTLKDALPKALRVQDHVSAMAKLVDEQVSDIEFMDKQLGNSEKE